VVLASGFVGGSPGCDANNPRSAGRLLNQAVPSTAHAAETSWDNPQ